MNQDKGIGAYRDRPGYFMGGMIGGAILGALVNKVQGKDWKKGAMWGGVTGGLGSAFLGPESSGWISKMNPGIMKSLATWGSGNPALAGGLMGGGAGYLVGDPEGDRRKREEEMERKKLKQIAANKRMYADYYTNPWTGDQMHNTGGMINTRKGYYPGGDVATDMQYVDPDLYTPTGEGGGPSSSPIRQIPMGPEGSFADEFEGLDLASNPSVGAEAFQSYKNYLMNNNLTEEQVPFETFIEMWRETAQAAPQTQGRFPLVGGEMTGGGGEMANAQTQGRFPLIGGEMTGGGQQGPMMAAEGGIADLDMRGGGHSMGPGTGTSDDVPAMLSDGEFVMTANAVSNLGGGDRMVGAQRMYNMMNQLDPNSQTPGEMNVAGYG